jgi:NlpC/P60 family protein
MKSIHKTAWALYLCLTILIPASSGAAVLPSHPRLQAARRLLLQLGVRIHRTKLDCSHFVNTLYSRAGLQYKYSVSRNLYRGIAQFQRVSVPEPGDLVVWPTHVGIVVEPERHNFLSAIASGVKTSCYVSRYWRKKGKAHFFRYVPQESQPDAAGNSEASSPAG